MDQLCHALRNAEPVGQQTSPSRPQRDRSAPRRATPGHADRRHPRSQGRGLGSSEHQGSPPLTAKRGATPSPTTETDSAPSPRPTLTAEATPASSLESTSATSTQAAPKKHTTARWALACAASWILVIAFIGVLVFTWSHLGDSNAIYEDSKEKAQHAQEERDRAQSTLDDINRQIEEAQQ